MVVEDIHTLSGAMLDLVERMGSRPRGGERRSLTLALTRSELLDERPSWGSNAINAVLLRMDPLSMDEAIDPRSASGRRLDHGRRGHRDRQAHRREPVLHRRDDRHALAGERRRSPDERRRASADGAGGRHRPARRAAPAAPHARQARLGLPVLVRPRRARSASIRTSRPTSWTSSRRRRSWSARKGGGAPYWRMRHATLRDVAYGSLPKRERVRLHETIADRLISSGYHSFAAEHLELAALASLDLNPLDRRMADRAVDQLIHAGDRARRRMVSRAAVDLYERALALAGPEETWGVREGRALGGLGEARYWLGSTKGRPRCSTRAVALGEAQDDPFTLALALRFLGDIAINVDADLEKAESSSTARCRRGAAGRPVGDHAHAPVRRLGAVDAGSVRRRGCHLAACARRRRSRRPVGADPRAHRAVDQPRQQRRPGGRARADRGRGCARRRRGRSVQRRGRDRPTRACDRGPGADGGGPRRHRTGHLHLRGAGRAVGIGGRAGRARHPEARARPPGRSGGRPSRRHPYLRRTGRAPARRLDMDGARARVAERRGDEAEAKERFRRAEEAEARRPR